MTTSRPPAGRQAARRPTRYRVDAPAATANLRARRAGTAFWTSGNLRDYNAAPPHPMLPLLALRLLAALVLSAPLAAHATTVMSSPDAWERLCAHAVPATEAYDLPLWEGSIVLPEGSGDALSADGVPWLGHVDAEHDDVAPCTDPVITTLRARDYARDRGAALLDTYEVALDASQFALDGEDLDDGELRVPLPPAVDVTGAGTWLAFGRSTQLRFDAGVGGESLLTRHALGSVSLRLVFTLETRTDPSRAYCGTTDDGSKVVFGRLVEAELVDALTQVSHGRTVTASYVDEQVRALAAERSGATGYGRPIAEVTAIELTGTLGCSQEEAAIVQSVVEALATECYVGGLARNGRLQGAAVLMFDIDPAGWVATYEMVTDAVSSDYVTTCLDESVRRIRLHEPPTSDGLAIRTTIVFRSEPR